MRQIDTMLAARIAAVTGGVVLAAYGVVRLLTDVPGPSLLRLAVWLVGALVISDLVVTPLVVAIGAGLRRWLPDRARRHLQAFLIMAAMITIVAVLMIYRQGTAPPEKALLSQDFSANLLILLSLAALISLTGYVAERMRTPPARRSGH